MTPDPDYSTWYTKHEAGDKLQVSTKTIEKFAKDGQVQQARWRRPTGGAVLTVFAREDVDRLATERGAGVAPPPFVVPAGSPAAAGNGQRRQALAPIPPRSNIDGAAILQAMVQTFQKASESSEKLFLTIPEAAEFTGLSQAYIRRACQTKKRGFAIRDGGWKIRRSALVAL